MEHGRAPGFKFAEPQSITEGIATYREVVANLEQIECQLTSTGRKARMGQREYSVWKSKAMNAKMYKLAELRSLRAWLRDHDISEDALKDSPTAQGLLALAYDLLKRWGGLIGWENISDEQQDLLDRIQGAIGH